VSVTFDKQYGPNRWPDVTPPGWTGTLQYSLGMAFNLDGETQWYASAPIQFWYGLNMSGGPIYQPGQIPNNWFYDDRWGPMAGYQPAVGEEVGMFVCEGNCRDVLDGSQSFISERTNVVTFAMPDGPTAFGYPDDIQDFASPTKVVRL